MGSKLISKAKKKYLASPLASWILGLSIGIMITALLAIDLLVPMLSALIFPFVIVPIIFSASLQHLLIQNDKEVSLKTAFRGFGLYFTSDFRGIFRFLSCLLKAIICFFIFEMTISFIASTLFQFYSPAFVDTINYLYEAINSEEFALQDFYTILEMNDGVLFTYLCIVFFPSIYIAIIYLIYNISRNSIMLYFKMEHPQINARFMRFVYSEYLSGNRIKALGEYLSLQWPLIVLLALGFGGGTYLGYLWKQDILIMLATGLIGGALLTSFFLPFYFNNQEAIYECAAERFNAAGSRVAKLLVTNIQMSIDLSKEEKERLEKSFDDMNPLDDDDKKDPDGP